MNALYRRGSRLRHVSRPLLIETQAYAARLGPTTMCGGLGTQSVHVTPAASIRKASVKWRKQALAGLERTTQEAYSLSLKSNASLCIMMSAANII